MNNNKKTILIIDDDSRNIYALTAVLKAKGFIIFSATSMVEALALLNEQPAVNVILMDMMMPEMDGYEAIPLLKKSEKFSGIPVISLTAQAMAGDKEKCLAIGANDYVSKPVDIDLLVGLLNKYA